MMPNKRSRDIKYIDDRSIPEPNSGCWLWLNTVHHTEGYGIGYDPLIGKNDTAHRIAYRIVKGEIAKGLKVLHTCDVRSCCNPDHLYLGNDKNNSDDKYRRGRANHPRGSLLKQTKLTEKQVKEIRNIDLRYSNQYVACLYGVTRPCIDSIRKRKRWKYV